MKAAFTPGPWLVEADDSCIVFQKSSRRIICDIERANVTGSKAHQDRQEADAQLIAAAPDLLEACKLFIEYDKNDATDGVAMMFAYSYMLKACRAAIAKATGATA